MQTLARSICTAEPGPEAWAALCAGTGQLFWTSDEELHVTWQRLFGSAVGGDDVECLWRDHPLRYRYRGRTRLVPLRSDPDDGLRMVHALARLVRHDAEFRLCTATLENSEQAFLAMPPADWAALEALVGRKAVSRCFSRLAAGFDAFLRKAFHAPGATQGPPARQRTVWAGVVSYCPTDLEYVIVSDGPGHLRGAVLAGLMARCLHAGPVGLCVGASDEERSVPLEELAAVIAEHVCRASLRVVDATRAGFLLIESNGVAAGWRGEAGAAAGAVAGEDAGSAGAAGATAPR